MKKITLGLLFLIGGQLLFAQEEPSRYEPLQFSTQNFIKYNDFLLNPTFSQAGEDRDYISLYYGSQMAGFEGAPVTYMLNYATKVNENAGAALGAFQKTHGIFTSYGAYANYAYGIQFSEKVWLTLGANLVYVANDVKYNGTDIALNNIEKNSSISLRPGLNLKVGKFDIGAYAENVLLYSFSSETQLEQAKRFSGHLMFTTHLGEKSYLKLLARGQKADSLMRFGGNALFGLSNLGYLQVGYDTYEAFSTASVGLGIKLTKNITLSYVIGKGMGEIEEMPTNHEIMFVYNFRGNSAKADVDKTELLAKNDRIAAQQDELAALREEMAAKAKENQAMQRRLDSIYQAEQNRAADKVRQVETNNANGSLQPSLLVSSYSSSEFYKVSPGYYIIANVFVKEKNLTRFLGALRAKGLHPGVFVRKSNGYNYVYLEQYDHLDEAVRAAQSDVDGRYTADIWILEII